MANRPTEVWQARIDSALAVALRADAETLGLTGRTDIVKAGLELLHRRAAEERMARDIAAFNQGRTAPLPVGVRPSRRRPATGVAPEARGHDVEDTVPRSGTTSTQDQPG